MKSLKPTLLRLIISALATLIVSLPSYSAPLTIGNIPLYLTSGASPNVLLNMSVETPMGGAAYNDQAGNPASCAGRLNNVLSDSTADDIGSCYYATSTYLGYFDANKCYTYDTGNSRFNPAGATASDHSCSSQWSGNFLNWATMTAIDMFIYTMTGGNRVQDSTTLTVVRRARKQNNNSWFPRKVLNSTINVAPSTVTPYSDTTLFIHNTTWGFQLGTTFAVATGGSPTYGPFAADVRVCETAANRESNCIGYGTAPSTYYKPEGMVQRNASTKRFGVMAYTNDNSQGRWGGVLRAPMKYVGPTMPNGSGGTVSNTNTEWGTDGILIANPDSATAWSQSGVINYINKFSSASAGYKSFDPIGELYYESLRYLKGAGLAVSPLQATPEAHSGITLDSTDAATGGFPIYTTWTDPMQYSCQRQFIVAINDANPWLDKTLPGTFFTTASITGAASTTYTLTANDYGQPTNADTAINVTTLTNAVGNWEGLNSTGIWNQSGTTDSVGGGAGTFDNSCNNKTASAMNLGEIMGTCPYPPKQNSYYIAGLAHYANTNDMRTDMANWPPSNPRPQTISSFFIDTQEFSTEPLSGNHNMLWLAAKYGGFTDRNSDAMPGLQSGVTTPASLTAEWDSDSNGVPDNYVLASQPQELVDGLNRAFVDIDSKTATASAVALNSSTVSSDTRVYQATFNSSFWSGDLISYPVNSATGNVDFANPSFTGGSAAPNVPAYGSRVIITRKGDFNTSTFTTARGIAFRWPSDPTAPTTPELSATQISQIKTGGANDTLGSQRLEYLRGNTFYELQYNRTPTFRDRFSRPLGDLINSAPVHVGKPLYLPNGVESASPHSTFRATSAVANRTPIVYIGGNDGMMHGFNALTGAEVLAYVPNGVFPELYQLTSTNYSHRYYVDGQITYGDAYGAFANCGSGSCWRTILVGALGAGGKGVYALDVTDPSAFTEGNAAQISLWEKTAGGNDPSVTTDDDLDLGNIYGQPIVAKMHDGTWRAIFSNGYNSSNERAVLYLVNIVNPASTNGIIKVVLGSTSTGQSNGLSAPAVVDVDGDYVADFVYAGDLKGNMWKVDVTGNSTSTWDAAWGTSPLFTATQSDASTTAQPITAKPEVGLHPAGQTGYMVYFGTGQYLQESDKTNTQQQTFYGIWDRNTNSASTSADVPRNRLKPQTISTATIGSTTVRSISDISISGWGGSGTSCNQTTSAGNCLGWKVNLPETGERVVTDALLLPTSQDVRILFTTTTPNNAPCGFGGSSWVMELDPTNGGQLSGAIFDVNEDGAFNSSDLIGGTTTPAGVQNSDGILSTGRILHGGTTSPPGQMHKYFGSTSGTVEKVTNSGGLSPSRQSWRQLK